MLLPVPPADAARLASGEPVRVWVEQTDPPVPDGYKIVATSSHGYFLFGAEGDDWPLGKTLVAPAARGDRVGVECPSCRGEGWRGSVELGYYQCPTCRSEGYFAARVLADPVPERWCERCEGGGDVWEETYGEAGEALPASESCPACHGAPPWGWWYELGPEPRKRDDGT